MVITALTRNQVVAQAARGFESHPVRQRKTGESNGFIGFYLFIYGYSFIFNIFSRQQKYISNLLSVKTSCIFLFPVQSRRQHFHLPKPHPVYQALQLDKRGAIHIYGGLQKSSGQTDFVYSFELVARKRYSIISLLDLWGRFETQNYITVNILRRLDAYRVFHFV